MGNIFDALDTDTPETKTGNIFDAIDGSTSSADEFPEAQRAAKLKGYKRKVEQYEKDVPFVERTFVRPLERAAVGQLTNNLARTGGDALAGISVIEKMMRPNYQPSPDDVEVLQSLSKNQQGRRIVAARSAGDGAELKRIRDELRDAVEESKARYATLMKSPDQAQGTPAVDAMRDVGILSGLALDPTGIASEGLVESGPAMVPGILAGIAVGAATKNPYAAAVASGILAGDADRRASFLQGLQNQGVDIANTNSVYQALSNPEMVAAAERSANIRGAAVGATEIVGGGVLGKLAKGAGAGAGIGRKVAAATAGSAAEAATGAGGELLAQVASGQQIDPVDIALEGLLEVPGGLVEQTGAIYSGLSASKNAAPAGRLPGGGRGEPPPEPRGRGVAVVPGQEPSAGGQPSPTDLLPGQPASALPAPTFVPEFPDDDHKTLYEVGRLMSEGRQDEAAALAGSLPQDRFALDLNTNEYTNDPLKAAKDYYAALASGDFAERTPPDIMSRPNEWKESEIPGDGEMIKVWTNERTGRELYRQPVFRNERTSSPAEAMVETGAAQMEAATQPAPAPVAQPAPVVRPAPAAPQPIQAAPAPASAAASVVRRDGSTVQVPDAAHADLYNLDRAMEAKDIKQAEALAARVVEAFKGYQVAIATDGDGEVVTKELKGLRDAIRAARHYARAGDMEGGLSPSSVEGTANGAVDLALSDYDKDGAARYWQAQARRSAAVAPSVTPDAPPAPAPKASRAKPKKAATEDPSLAGMTPEEIKALRRSRRGIRMNGVKKKRDRLSLAEFVAVNGGVIDQSGELRQSGYTGRNTFVAGGYGPVVRKNGRALDDMLRSAQSAGYYDEDSQPTVADLLNDLAADLDAIKAKTQVGRRFGLKNTNESTSARQQKEDAAQADREAWEIGERISALKDSIARAEADVRAYENALLDIEDGTADDSVIEWVNQNAARHDELVARIEEMRAEITYLESRHEGRDGQATGSTRGEAGQDSGPGGEPAPEDFESGEGEAGSRGGPDEDGMGTERVTGVKGAVEQGVIPGAKRDIARAREGKIAPKAAQKSEFDTELSGDKSSQDEIPFRRAEPAPVIRDKSGKELKQIAPKASAYGIEATGDEARIATEALTAEGRKHFGNAFREIKVFERVTDDKGRDVKGAYAPSKDGGIIALALAVNGKAEPRPDVMATLIHEGMHSLRVAGVVSKAHDAEALRIASRDPEITEYLKGYPENQHGQEAIAEIARRWMSGDTKIAGPFLTRLFRRIRAFLRDLGGVLRKRNHRFAETIDDVLRNLAEGRYADSQPLSGRGVSFAKAPPIDSAAFKAWFGDSKVVDAEGRPLVVYHGTPERPTEEWQFSPRNSRRSGFMGSERTVQTRASFFSDDATLARSFGQNRSESFQRASVIPVHLSMNNPLDLTGDIRGSIRRLKDAGITVDRHGDPIEKALGKSDLWQVFDDNENIARLEKAGYDGAIISDSSAARSFGIRKKGAHRSWVAFSPTQIKSVNNRGTFDPNDPRIMFARATDDAPPRKTGGYTNPRPFTDNEQVAAFERGESKKVLKRGIEQITKRADMERAMGSLSEDDMSELRGILEFIGAKLLTDVNLSIRGTKDFGALGQFNDAAGVITVFRNAIISGRFGETFIHEVWHSVEGAIPPIMRRRLQMEYKRVASNYVKKHPYMREFIAATAKNGDPKGQLDFKSLAEAMADPVIGPAITARRVRVQSRSSRDRNATASFFDPNSIALSDPVSVVPKWSQENYRYHNASEYFAVGMTEKYQSWTEINGESSRNFLGALRSLYRTAIAKIKSLFSRLGYNNLDSLFYSFANSRFSTNDNGTLSGGGIMFARGLPQPPGGIASHLPPPGMDWRSVWGRGHRATTGVLIKKMAERGPIRSTLLGLERAFTDENAAIRRTIQAIAKINKTDWVPSHLDPYTAIELHSRRTAFEMKEVREKFEKPLIDALSRFGKKHGLDGESALGALELYAMAFHAPERNAYVAQRTNGENLSGSGMTDDGAQDIIAQIIKNGWHTDLESMRQILVAVNRHALKMRQKAGLISLADYNQMTALFPNFVPLRGVQENAEAHILDPTAEEIRPMSGVGWQVKGREFRRIEGRSEDSLAGDVVANSINYVNEAIIRGNKNQAMNRLKNLVEFTLKPLPDGSVPGQNFWKVVSHRSAAPKSGHGSVQFKDDGQNKWIVFGHDPRLQEALARGAGASAASADMQVFVSALQNISSMFKMMQTGLNPVFWIVNATADLNVALYTAGATGEKGIRFGLLRNYGPAVKALAKAGAGKKGTGAMDAALAEFEESGGKLNWTEFRTVDRIAGDMARRLRDLEATGLSKAGVLTRRGFRHVIETIEDMNGVFENASRLAIFKALRDRGWSKEKAATTAMNLTINFTRKGTVSRYVEMLFPFFNASLQGAVTIARATTPKRLMKYSALMFSIGVIMEILNQSLSDEDDDGELYWDKAYENKTMDRQLAIMLPGLKAPITIRLGYIMNLPFVAGREAARMGYGKSSPADAALRVLGATADSYVPMSSPVPFFAQPIYDIAKNENYFGQPIHPKEAFWLPPTPNWSQSMPNTPWLAKKAAYALSRATGGEEDTAGAIDWRPDDINYVVSYFLGGIGRLFSQTSRMAEKASGVADTPLSARDIPFLSQVYRGENMMADQRKMRDRIDLIRAADGRFEAKMERGLSYGAAKEQMGEDFVLLTLKHDADSAKSRITQAYRRRRAALDKKLPIDRIEKIDAEINAIVDQFNRKYNQTVQRDR